MPKANPQKYLVAQELVRIGVWRVDPDAGLVYGPRGKAFTRIGGRGYVQIGVYRPGGLPRLLVQAHRVLWEFIHGPLDCGLAINHKNGIKTDNRLRNLEAVTDGENMRHAYATGLYARRIGEQHLCAKLTEADVRQIMVSVAAGERDVDIARSYPVEHGAIAAIRRGWSWNEVTGIPARR